MPRAKQRTPELRDRVLAAAQAAGTSVPAIYDLFGDKAGLVREMFFTGVLRLHARLLEREAAADARTVLVRTALTFRAFAQAEPVLSQLMFSRPFGEFDPRLADARAGAAVRDYVVGRMAAAVDAGALHGDPVDIAHVLLATVQGLAVQETAGWLGSTPASLERRWNLAVATVLDGLAPTDADAP